MLETGVDIDAVGAPQRQAFTEHAGLDSPITTLTADISAVGRKAAAIGEVTARVLSTSLEVYGAVKFKVLILASPP